MRDKDEGLQSHEDTFEIIYMSTVLTVMMTSWRLEKSKCIKLYILNMYSLLYNNYA